MRDATSAHCTRERYKSTSSTKFTCSASQRLTLLKTSKNRQYVVGLYSLPPMLSTRNYHQYVVAFRSISPDNLVAQLRKILNRGMKVTDDA